MTEDKKWMLMTYYCPTHGDAGRVEAVQISRQEISKVSNNKNNPKKSV